MERSGRETIELFQLTQEETVALGEDRAGDPRELIPNTECPGADVAGNACWISHHFFGMSHISQAAAWRRTPWPRPTRGRRDILTMSARRRQMYLEELRPR